MLEIITRLILIAIVCFGIVYSICNIWTEKYRLSLKLILSIFTYVLTILCLSNIWWMPFLEPSLFQWKKTVQQGVSEYQSDEYDKAVPIFSKALQEFPKASQIRLWLADCYLKLDNKNQAIEQYLEVIKHDDTGKYVIQARKVLTELNVNDKSMNNPTHTDAMCPPIEVSWMKIKLDKFEQRLNIFIVTDNILGVALFISIVFLLNLFIPEDKQIKVPVFGYIFFFLFAGLWLNCLYYGRTYSLWYYTSNGWIWPILLKETLLTLIIVYMAIRITYNMPESTLWLVLLTILIGTCMTIVNLRSNYGSRFALITARTLNIIFCLWFIRLHHGLGPIKNNALRMIYSCFSVLIPIPIN